MNLEDYSIIAWLLKNGMKNEKGDPITFKNHMFQYDIYRDFHPNQVSMKGAQIGYTVLEILKAFFIAKTMGIDIIFTQPTDTDVTVFSAGKVNRIIKHNPVLQECVKEKDSVEQKSVGDSMIYYRGTFSKKAAISVTADLLIHDEVDFSDQDVIGDYESRLQHSKYKWKWYFGHPSTAGTGVHHYWELSDKRHWFVKCTHCNTWQYLSFPESICPERKIYQCKKCKKEITDKDRDSGQWVKKYQQREYHGYLVSLLMAPWMPASKILQYKEEKTEEYFCNRVLGLPYIGSGNKVAESTIMQNLTSRPNPQDGNVVIGIDTGINLDYVVGNERGIFHYGTTKKYEDIEAMLKRWKNSVAVFDQGGDLIGSREMREKYPGRVFLCHYRQDRKTMQLIKWGEKEERGNVVVDRNRMLQLCIDEFEKKKMNIFGTRKDWWGFWLHWNAIFRVKEEDSLGVSVYKWKRSGADHFCHAYLYFRVGISKFANAEGEIFSADRPDIDNIIKR